MKDALDIMTKGEGEEEVRESVKYTRVTNQGSLCSGRNGGYGESFSIVRLIKLMTM